MEDSIFQIAEQINQLHKKVYNIYLPLVDNEKYRKRNYPICLIICWTFPVMKKCWNYIKRCAEGISIFIRVVLSLILMHIGKCGKMKMIV